MSMEVPQRQRSSKCPRCRRANLEHARYCANCGLPLSGSAGEHAGRVKHPQPVAAPDGYRPCDDAVQMYYACESGFGGASLIGTEGVRIRVFNAGYDLLDVVFQVSGRGADGQALFSLERSVDELPQGGERLLEVPSYEVNEPLGDVRVALVHAEFAPPE